VLRESALPLPARYEQERQVPLTSNVSKTDTDVAIVGAGPAGSALALQLARAGVRVLLLDRAAFPRPKPCGDCLSAEATRVLDRLGLSSAVEAAGPAHLDGWRIIAPAGSSFSARFSDMACADPRISLALAMPRHRLDNILLDAARAAGATVLTRATVNELVTGPAPYIVARTDGGVMRMSTRIVIGADGLRSIIARRAGAIRRAPRRWKFSLTAHVSGAALPDALGEMHLTAGMCVGLAAVGQGMFNLTLVADADRHARDGARDPAAFFRTALRRFPALRQRLADVTLEGEPLFDSPHGQQRRSTLGSGLLASGPFDVPTRRIVGNGFALVGDAAGYFDPFTGQGVYQALRGAELLAPAVLNALASPALADHHLETYAAAHRRLTRPVHIFQRLLDTVLRYPNITELAVRRLAAAPAAAHALLAASADVRAPVSLLSPAVVLSFALPVQWRPAQ
jgi:flavin-dependent dehydrogenase